jgi:hypothetical protein
MATPGQLKAIQAANAARKAKGTKTGRKPGDKNAATLEKEKVSAPALFIGIHRRISKARTPLFPRAGGGSASIGRWPGRNYC